MRRAIVCLLTAAAVWAQRGSGELRIRVKDQSGLPLEASGTLSAPAMHVRTPFRTDSTGVADIRNIPFGSYRVEVAREGFVPESRTVDVSGRAEIAIALGVGAMRETVTVEDADPLIDPSRTGTSYFVGHDELRDRRTATPGRSAAQLIDQEPGWLLEANGVLHPRGAEYGVQYVVDGIPVTENRSPSFAADIDVEEVEEMNVMTSGYPAEFGRKLGGVVEVVTTPDRRPGTHGKVSSFGQSFDTAGGYARLQHGWGTSSLSLSADAARTGRYLDPPVLENYTNNGTTGGFGARYERDLSQSDRVRFRVERRQARFDVPNERVQQDMGQRQDRSSDESVGTVAYTRVLSPAVVLEARGMGRNVSAGLWSNETSIPIAAWQSRGFREGYGAASLAAQFGGHAVKTGGEISVSALNESFSYVLTDPSNFDQDVPWTFQFAGRNRGREAAAYVQDSWRRGPWTISAGLRFDSYRLLVADHAWSPRLGVAWHSSAAGLVVRASYDRVFQTPAFENLLLASSPEAQALGAQSVFLPVRPSRGDFVEAGFVKSVGGRARLDAKYFHRQLDNVPDDDVLLNTGVTFPVAFRSGEVRGTEVKLESQGWGPVSGYLSYTNMIGWVDLPVAGGLFLGDEAQSLVRSTGRIVMTQDQRNMARAWARTELGPRAWASAGASYGSGLPVEAGGIDLEAAHYQYGDAVLSRVNFARGRVRPSFSLDLSAGADVLRREPVIVRVQADVLNVTDRLNVINFAGVFSGTALAAPRTASVRVALEF